MMLKRSPARQVARADRLQGHHRLGPGDDRIDGEMGIGAVRLLPLDPDAELVDRGHRRPGVVADLADLEVGEGVEGEDRLRLLLLEQSLLEHQAGAPLLAGGGPLLGRLEDEQHAPRQVGADRGEDGGDAELHRGVDVVAAGVGHSDVSPQELVTLGRLEGEVGLLGHRQRVHVGADGDQRAGLASLEQGDHAGLGDAGARLEPEAPQVGGDQLGRLALAVRELGVLMDVMPHLDELGRGLLRLLVDPCVERRMGGGAWGPGGCGGRGVRPTREHRQGESQRQRRQASRSPARGHAFLRKRNRAVTRPSPGRGAHANRLSLYLDGRFLSLA
jgi:hypothetical protein